MLGDTMPWQADALNPSNVGMPRLEQPPLWVRVVCFGFDISFGGLGS